MFERSRKDLFAASGAFPVLAIFVFSFGYCALFTPRGLPNGDAALPPRLLVLHLSGKGRKKLEVTIQLGLARQGGWRVVRSRLPTGPATALTLRVPIAGTEIRQQGLADRATWETTEENETIETALTDGQINLQWRDKVSEGQVDQSLTAKSTAVLDVREDSLHLVWQVRLEFGRAFRDDWWYFGLGPKSRGDIAPVQANRDDAIKQEVTATQPTQNTQPAEHAQPTDGASGPDPSDGG